MAFLTKDENGNIVAVKEFTPVSLDEIQEKIDYYTGLKSQYETLAGAEVTSTATPAPAAPAAPAEQPVASIPAIDQSGNAVDAGGASVTPSVDVNVTPAAPAQPAVPAYDPNAGQPVQVNQPIAQPAPQQFPQ